MQRRPGRKAPELRKTGLGEIGSGNVFADLGLPNPEELLLKAQLVAKIDDVIGKRGLTQMQAAALMDLPQPKISALRNGRTEGYSVERLYRLLNRLGVGISVVLQEQPGWESGRLDVYEVAADER